MTERRPLTEGLKPPGEPNRLAEEQFVFGGKAKPVESRPAAPPGRVPVTTRIRGDYAGALKRASLERQLQQIEPNSLQDILEQALEPWLRTNGYLP